jgi:hypothetical protein
VRIGNFNIPTSAAPYRLPVDPADSSRPQTRKELLVHLAALFADVQGRLPFDIVQTLCATFTLWQQDEAYVLGLLADLRLLGFIKRTDVVVLPFQIVTEPTGDGARTAERIISARFHN